MQLKMFMESDLYPWQKVLLEEVQKVDDRLIKIIWDALGNTGKSIFAEYLEYKGLAFEEPPMCSMGDIM